MASDLDLAWDWTDHLTALHHAAHATGACHPSCTLSPTADRVPRRHTGLAWMADRSSTRTYGLHACDTADPDLLRFGHARFALLYRLARNGRLVTDLAHRVRPSNRVPNHV